MTRQIAGGCWPYNNMWSWCYSCERILYHEMLIDILHTWFIHINKHVTTHSVYKKYIRHQLWTKKENLINLACVQFLEYSVSLDFVYWMGSKKDKKKNYNQETRKNPSWLEFMTCAFPFAVSYVDIFCLVSLYSCIL